LQSLTIKKKKEIFSDIKSLLLFRLFQSLFSIIIESKFELKQSLKA